MNNSKRLSLLLTNDDGIFAEGLQILAEKLKKVADVYILAPDSNRSAVSSHIVMHQSLTFKKVAERQWSCSGYPADCVISALRSDLFKDIRFDAVLSGINRGPNMGTDCIYSGTIAAARQAVLYGLPGIAFSLKAEDGDYAESGYDYGALADFAADNVEGLISLYQPDCIVSVNAKSQKDYSAAVLTSLCIRDYEDRIEFEEVEDGILKSTLVSGKLTTTSSSLVSEHRVVDEGKIAVTRLRAEPVDFDGSLKGNVSFVFGTHG